jgi:hypothetical protein
MEIILAIIGLVSLISWIVSRHPLFSLPLLIAGSILLEDSTYPFSSFPMYSDPDDSENYLYLARRGENGAPQPLPVRRLTGMTAPTIKKMYMRYLDDYAKEDDERSNPMSREERAAIGRQILAFYRDQGEKRGSEMPDELILVEVWIRHDELDKGFTETPEVIARLSSSDRDVPPPGVGDSESGEGE